MGRKIVSFSEAGLPIYDDELIDQYVGLVKAIVKQARTDYISMYQELLTAKSASKIKGLTIQIRRLERFFTSSWFNTLVGGNGAEIIEALRIEAFKKLKALYLKRAEKEY